MIVSVAMFAIFFKVQDPEVAPVIEKVSLLF
ncbi:MAG: hypothetical protein ACI81G_000693 [Gammaproteobacteria bacterium]